MRTMAGSVESSMVLLYQVKQKKGLVVYNFMVKKTSNLLPRLFGSHILNRQGCLTNRLQYDIMTTYVVSLRITYFKSCSLIHITN